jgi:hypothetical protein
LVNLTTINLAAGDGYSIFPCDTLSSLFGTPATTGVVGGSSPATADIVNLMVLGAWRQYYYGTSGTPGWKRVGLNTASDNIPVRPDALVLYGRLGNTQLNLVLVGEVPYHGRKQIIRKSGVTPISNPWPSGVTTLSSSGISSSSGWTANTSFLQADSVFFMVSGAWRQYYHDGTNWRRVGLNTLSDNVEIPVGSGVLVSKLGSASSSVDVNSPIPFSL